MKTIKRIATIIGLSALCYVPIVMGSYLSNNSLSHNTREVTRQYETDIKTLCKYNWSEDKSIHHQYILIYCF